MKEAGERPIVVPVGGFLGAGKTTLILTAARILKLQGLRAAAILNDQGADLVDTRLARASGLDADEVTGGCFCCRFSDLIDALDRIRQYRPDVIFAEAVGSCTDLAATTLRPLLRDHGTAYRVAPLSVLVDPARARELLSPAADPDLAFLFQNQLAEADLVCFTKADIGADVPELPEARVRHLSGKTGQGVSEWLDEICSGELRAGERNLEIDYGRYAEAEAALSWMNCRADLALRTAQSPAMVIGPFLDRLCARLPEAGIEIAHLKALDECPTGYIKAAVCADGEEPQVEGALDASPANLHELLINLRATGAPEQLKEILERELAALPGRVNIRLLQCFRPSPPQPEHRLALSN
jgi:Ni2+-binding GTPase involved in maturation of urease and hydrogenase